MSSNNDNFSINDGLHGAQLEVSPPLLGVIAAFMGMAMWICLEMTVHVFRFFARYHGLYFWSLLVLAWGIILHSVGYLLAWFAYDQTPWELYAVMNAVGWSMFITAESLVLYSRMHLVTRNVVVHRFVLGMIIFTAFTVQIPDWIFAIAAASKDPEVSAVWSMRDSIQVRVQQVAFLVQEGTISGLYIYYAYRMLKPNTHVRERRVVWDLILVSGFVVLMDVLVITLAFMNLHLLKEPLMNFAYALKLKLEFFVLNQLMEVTGQGFSSSGGGKGGRGGARRSRYHAPTLSSEDHPQHTTASDSSSKEPLHEKHPSFGSPAAAPHTASHNDSPSPPPPDPMLTPPMAARVRVDNTRSPVSPLSASAYGGRADAFFAGKALEEGGGDAVNRSGHDSSTTVVAPLRVSSRNASRNAGERPLPPEPSTTVSVGEPPVRSWLDLEGRLTDVEKRLNLLA